MADLKSIFRSLSTGISFDKKRFKSDAEKFGLTLKSNGTQKPTEFMGMPELPNHQGKDVDREKSTDEESSSSEEEQEFKFMGDMAIKRKKSLKNSKSHAKKMRTKAVELYKQNVNRFRNAHRIHVFGTDVPEPIDSWEKLASKFEIAGGLVEKLSSSYERPTPVQMQAIPLMMEKRQILVCAPTGSGKTAAFLIPLIQLLNQEKGSSTKRSGVSALIVSPTRELAMQIYREFIALSENTNLRPFVIDKVTNVSKKLSSGQVDVVISTPNRLVYMIKQNPTEICLKKVKHLVIDESDKLFEAGERGFRDQLAIIYRACGDSGPVHWSMFSATLAPDVEQWCKLNLDNPVTVTIGERNRATESVEQTLMYTTEKTKLQTLQDLFSRGVKPPVLIFVQSKSRAQELHDELAKDKDLRVDVIHSDRSDLQRDQTVKAFRGGRVWILICTELLGRGIDFKGVNMVINYDFPTSSSSYIHRIGRTGRAGRRGQAITFFTKNDSTLLRSIAQIIKTSGGDVPEYMLKMKKATRQEKRYLAKHQINREQISRESQYDREKRLRKELSIARTKKMKKIAKEGQIKSGESGNVENESSENSVQTKSRLKSNRKKLVGFKTSKIGKPKKMKRLNRDPSSK